MSQSLTRRELLRRSAGAIILGFPFLGAGCTRFRLTDETPEEPAKDVLALARERMKSEVKPGVIVVIPENPAAATQLAGQLMSLLSDPVSCCEVNPVQPVGIAEGPPPSHPHWLFCQAVFVCLPLDAVKQVYPAAAPDTAVVLLDLDGEPVEALKAEPELLGTDFAAKVGELLHGKKGERLTRWAMAQSGTTGITLQGLADGLSDPQIAAPSDTYQRLRDLAPRCTAMLALLLKEHPSPEVHNQVDKVFREMYAGASRHDPGPRQPFGTRWEAPKPANTAPCPACGLVCAPDSSRRFLRFLAKAKQ